MEIVGYEVDEAGSPLALDNGQFTIAANFYFNTLILGAFGCGVFGQDASDVATIFKNWLTGKYKNVFRHVIFAVPDSEHDINYLKFKNILSDCDE